MRSLIFIDEQLESFIYYDNSSIVDEPAETSDPQRPEEYYSYLSGLWRDESPMTLGGSGFNPGSTDTTAYLAPDLPNDASGWSMQTTGLPAFDKRTLSVVVDTMLLPGQIGTVDFVDYILVDEANRGLDVFSIYKERVSGIKADYEAMKRGFFDCADTPSSLESLSGKDSKMKLSSLDSGFYIALFAEEDGKVESRYFIKE